MTIDWDIEPATSPPVPRRPGSAPRRPRSWPKIPTRRHLIIGGAIGLAAIVSVAALGILGGSDGTRPNLAAGSRIGRQDPFAPRHPKYLANVWSYDLAADPTALLVDGEDAFVVGPYQVTDLDPNAGRERWHADVKDAEPYLAVDRNTVVVAAVDGFAALDRSSGASRWRVDVDSPADRGRTVGLVHAGGAEVAVVATKLGGVVGLDGVTGATRWSVQVDGSPRGRWATDRRSGTAALETTDGEHVTLRVFDAASGEVRWSAVLGRDTGVPTYVGDLLVLGTGRTDEGAVQAFAVADGARVWETPMTGSFEESMAPAVSGRSLVFIDKSGGVASIVAATGEVTWSMELPGRTVVMADSPAVSGDIMVLHDTFAQVHTVDLRTGAVLATRQSVGVPVGFGGTPNRIVYAQSGVTHGQVLAYTARTLASKKVTHP